MAGYSIGDRVEVRWKDALCPAEVTKLHASGKVDVVYEINSTVGVFLTAKEHGLKSLPEKEMGKVVAGGGKKKVCSVDDCSNNGRARGLCKVHARSPCSAEGCAAKAQARGLCKKHGEKKVVGGGKKIKVCSVNDCTTKVAARRWLCATHGKNPCPIRGCATGASARGLCSKHSAKPVCSWERCTTPVKSRGRCVKHGGGNRKVCKIKGCASLVQANSLCKKHGAHGKCQFAGCTTALSSPTDSHCITHGGNKKKPCTVSGCTTISLRKGLCCKHGGGKGPCFISGCPNQMVSTKNMTCIKHGGYGYCALE